MRSTLTNSLSRFLKSQYQQPNNRLVAKGNPRHNRDVRRYSCFAMNRVLFAAFFLACLHGLRSRPVDLTAYPIILGVGVNAEFGGVVGGG